MLTLFPRIRPNPIPPPPVPLEPPEPKAAEPAPETVSIRIVESTQPTEVMEAATEAVSEKEAPLTEGAPGADPATSVSDSDVFGAFLSGMAAGNSEPFIVEITARPTMPEPQDGLEQSLPASQILTERSPEVAESVAAAPSAEEAEASGPPLADAAVSPNENPGASSEVIAAQERTDDVSPELIVAGSNIFDELDVLHEAATATSSQNDTATSSDSSGDLSSPAESRNETVAEAVAKGVGQIKIEEEPHAAAPAPIAESELPAAVKGTANETPAAIPDEPSRVEDLPQDAGLDLAAVQLANERPPSDDGPGETAFSEIAAQEPRANAKQHKAGGTEAVEQPPGEAQTLLEATVAEVAPSSSEAGGESHTKLSAHSSLARAPRPRRAKGTFWGLERVPEPEIMDDSGEVEAYASAAAQAHLDAIDDTFVAHAQLLLKGRERGRVLDIGTGPGQIVIKLGYRLTRWKFVGIDRSATMIDKALESLATAGELAGRVEFRVADGNALDFPDKSFEMVVCNSVLHHIPQPQKLFSEIARVVKPGGAILLRDLRRPSRPGYAFHVWKHGKHYRGQMRQLFIASVQAAYTEEELQKMLAASPLRDVHVFRHGKTHIGFERPIAAPAASKR